jgi:hypothetical protein
LLYEPELGTIQSLRGTSDDEIKERDMNGMEYWEKEMVVHVRTLEEK